MSSRRSFLQTAVTAVAVLGGPSRVFGMNPPPAGTRLTPASAADRLVPRAPLQVITPDVKDLTFTIDNGTKVFQLIAEPVKRKIAPWKTIDW